MTAAEFLFDAILKAHVAAGFVSLLCFWAAIASKKGGKFHVRTGRVFEWCMYAVAVSAIVLCAYRLWDPFVFRDAGSEDAATTLRMLAVFLGYLGIVTLATTRHGVRVIRTRRDPESIRTPFHIALNAAAVLSGLAMIPIGLSVPPPFRYILIGMSPIGIFVGGGALGYIRRPGTTRMAWWYAHMGAMIGAGIAAHTAFLVFGAQRLFTFQLEGALAMVPWLAPTVVGVPAIFIWIAHYRRKFGETDAMN